MVNLAIGVGNILHRAGTADTMSARRISCGISNVNAVGSCGQIATG